jgi:large subunit ribosomal protein L21
MFAVIKTGGKQYLVSAGKKIKTEKIAAEPGEEISFDQILLKADGEKVEIGHPEIEGAKIKARVIRQGRDEKKMVFRYHSKNRYTKKKGHRQAFTESEILEIK